MSFVRFQELEVYRLAEELADAVWTIATTWQNFARDTVGKQLVRAVDSVSANIAEGSGRGSRVDNRRCVYIARGSFNETQHWLRRAFARKLLTPEQVEHLRALMDKLGPKLNAYLTSLNRSTDAPKPTDTDTKHQTLNTKH
jgi:four helix bundle protein